MIVTFCCSFTETVAGVRVWNVRKTLMAISIPSFARIPNEVITLLR